MSCSAARRSTPATRSPSAPASTWTRARRLWRALGFASTTADEVAFTDQDVAAIELVRRLAADAPMDDQLLHSMTRMLGQTFSRLASWQGQLVIEMLGKRPELLAVARGDRRAGREPHHA